MRKSFLIGIGLAVCLFTVWMAGCGREGAKPEPENILSSETAELVLFDKNSNRHSFDDRIAQEIMRRTGVTIRVIDSTDDAARREELMFTLQDYPDIIKVDLSAISKYQDAGYILELDPYLPQLPSVTEMYGDMLDRMRSSDGRLYYLGNWYGQDSDAVSGFQIRYDYLTELVGKERADSNEPFTQEEFLDLLRQFSRKHPEVGGKPSIPFTTCLDYEESAAFQGMYGMKSFYQQNDHLYHLTRDPRYVQMLSFMNRMYREGLMDREWVVNRSALYQEKLESGRVFATACAYWDISVQNAKLQAGSGDDAFFACYKVLGEGISPEETTYGGRNSMGWDAIAITDHCRNLDAALKVIDFLASEEGQYLMLWGIEGEDWNYVNGVRTPTEENLELSIRDISMAIEQTSIRRWLWFIKNGNGSDGSPYDMMTKYLPTREARLAAGRMQGDYWDTSEYMGLDPLSGTEESLMLTNIKSIYNKTFPRMVNADTEEEMLELYDKLLLDMDAEGLSAVEEVWTQNYQERMKQWNG